MRFVRRATALTTFLATIGLVLGTARTESVVYNFNPGQAGNQGFGGELGNDFVVNVPIRVTQVGVYDDLSNGISGTLTSQIWTRSGSTGTLVPGTTMTFNNADPGTLVDAVRLKPLPAPVVLQPGTYTFSSNGHSGADMNLNSNAGGFVRYADNGYGPVTTGPGTAPGLITIVGEKRYGATAGTFPANADGNWLYGSGTFAFEQADPTAYTVLAGTVGTQNYGGSLGMDFNANQPVTITHLGVFDSGSPGLSETVTARLYARHPDGSKGAELASLAFTGSEGQLIGGSRFKELTTPLSLPGGFNGTIVSEGHNAVDLNGNSATPTNWFTYDGGGALSFVGSGRFGTAGLYPATADGGPANRYAAGTFMFHATEAPPKAVVERIPVANGSFEQPAHGGPGGWTNSVPGWNTSDAGNFYPTPGLFIDPIPDGNQIGFANSGGTLISNPLPGPGLEADTLYILDVEWGDRTDGTTPDHSMNLRAGGQPLGWLNDSNMRKGPPVGPGLFESNRLYATANHNAAIGSPLDILLTAGVSQAAYDDVRVTKVTNAAILLNNPSFELDNVAPGGGWQIGAIGWEASTAPPNAGVFEDAAQITPADGLQSAFIENGASLTQTLTGVPLEANLEYVLLAEVADRGSTPFAGYRVELLAGGQTIAEDYDTLDVLETQAYFYVTSVVNVRIGDNHPLLGQDLGIRLSAPVSGGHAYFDNIRLFAYAVPEPSTFVLALLGITALAGWGWRKRRNNP